MNSLSNFQIPDVWEVKDVVNKLKNVVLNYTEMEAKVHDATNNEPWGASTTLMQEIAQGTFSYQYFNEIMPTIYRRFTEKESRQWRQIYKALVLLEYLVKNGSERVVDDARSHASIIKVLRNFYFIDEKGKDEGLNVRNRAKELLELLNNTDKIREERKLAKKNRNKYVGVGSDASGMRSMGGMSSASSASISGLGAGLSKYIGFGNDKGGVSFNGDGYNFGDASSYRQYNGKYDLDDDEGSSPTKEDYSFEEAKTNKQSNDDDWGDFTWGEPVQQQAANTNKSNSNFLDDDFADFQQAEIVSTNTLPQQQVTQKQDLFDLLGSPSSVSSPSVTSEPQRQSIHIFETKQPLTPTGYQQQQQQQQQQQTSKKEEESPAPVMNTGMWAQASNFVSLDSLGKKANTTAPTKGPSMNALKTDSVKSDWNNWANKNQTAAPKSSSSAFDDLLL